jgi:phage terminase large subunit
VTKPVTLEQALVERLPYWRVHPEAFVKECVGIGSLPGEMFTDQHRAACEEWGRLIACRLIKVEREAGVADADLHPTLQEFVHLYDGYANRAGMTVMSGKGTGKDFLLSMLILHFMSTMPGTNGMNTKVICTAASQAQLDDVLWSELSKWYGRRDPVAGTPVFLLHSEFELTASKFYYKGQRDTWFVTKRTSAQRSASLQSGTMAGLHANHMVVAFDEWSDISDQNTNALMTTLTSPLNFAIGVFNPTRRTGFAHRTHYDKDEAKNWIRLHWDSNESPLVQKSQIERYRKYGERSNLYRVNVLGLPPLSDDSTLIPWDWAIAAVENDGIVADDGVPVILGIDPAGDGSDRYVGCARQGGAILGFKEFTGRKLSELTPEILKHAGLMNAEYIVVDNTGGYGSGIVETLSRYHPRVFGPAMSEQAFRDDEFANIRAELYWRMRSAFERNLVRIPNDDQLIGELTCILAAGKTGGRLQVEGKREIRKRLGGLSPDHADAMMLTYYVDEFAEMDLEAKADRYQFDEDYATSWMSA